MPFPILRTPFLVLSEIISLLEPNEIVTASFCSKNLKCLLKRNYQQRKPLEWRLFLKDYDSRGRVDIGQEDSRGPVLTAVHISGLEKSIKPTPIETNEFKRGFSLGSIDLYFEDRVMGTKMIVDYVSDLFNLDVYGLVIDRNGIWAINWVNNRQEQMLECFEFNQNPKDNSNADEDLDYVLRNARASDYYVLDEFVSDNFRFDGKLGPVNHLLIDSNGHWVILDNLMTFDFIKIIVKGSRISESDVHSFLRHWRAGGSHQLTFLWLEFETDRNFDSLEEELDIIEADDLRLVFHCSFDYFNASIVFVSRNRDKWYLDSRYSIQRNDGVKAVIFFDVRCFVMTVLPPREII